MEGGSALLAPDGAAAQAGPAQAGAPPKRAARPSSVVPGPRAAVRARPRAGSRAQGEAPRVPGSELSPGARSILLQLRAAIRAKKPCRFTGVGQLETVLAS